MPLFSSTVELFVGVSVETLEDDESLFMQRCHHAQRLHSTSHRLDRIGRIASRGSPARAKSAFTRVFDALWGDPPAPMPAGRKEPGGIEAANQMGNF